MAFVMEEQMITIGGTLVLGILILAVMIYRQISQIMREKNRRNQLLKEMKQETKTTNFEQKEEIKGTPMKQQPTTETTEEEVIESNEVSFKAPQEIRQQEMKQEEMRDEVNTSMGEIPMPKLKFNQEYVSEVKNKFESLSDKIEEKISSINTPFFEKVAPRQETEQTEVSRAQHNDSMDDFESYEDFNLHPGHTTKSLFEVNHVNDVASYSSNSESLSPLKMSKVEESLIEDTCERQESENIQLEEEAPLTILNKVFEEMDSNEDSDYEQKDNEDESAEEELDEISSEVEEEKIDYDKEEIKESLEEEQISVESPPKKKTSSKRQSTFKEPITPKARSSRKSEDKENYETPSKSYSAKKTPKTVGSVRILRDRKSIKTPIRYGEYY